MANSRTHERNIRWMYALMMLRGCFFSVPVIVLFWQDNGLSISEVMFLQSLFALMAVVLEVPSGYLADLIGRSRALVASAAAQTIAIIIYSTGHSFLWFLAGEAFFAVCISLSSGADSALIYDSLKTCGKEGTFASVMGKTHAIELCAVGVANIIGGVAGRYDLRLTLFMSIPFFALTIPVSLMLREPPIHQSAGASGRFPSLRLILKTVVGNPDVRRIMILSAVLFAFNAGGLWLYQPYFSGCGIPVWSFGLIFASFQFVSAFSAWGTGRLLKTVGTAPVLIAFILASSGAYLLLGFFAVPLCFLFVYLQQWVRGSQFVVFSDAVNRHTDSSVRATVLSFQSLGSRLGYAALIPILGMAADAVSIPATFLGTGIAGAVICTLALIPVVKPAVFHRQP